MTEAITRLRLGVTAAGLALLLLAGCGGNSDTTASDGAAKKYTIGYVSPPLTIQAFKQMHLGAVAADKALADVKVEVGTAAPTGDPFTGMIPVIQNMLTRGVDIIVVPGIAQLVPSLKRVAAAKVPIVFYANAIPGSTLPKAAVYPDQLKGGLAIGKEIRERLGGKGTLAIIRYPKGQYPIIDERVNGVLGAIKGSEIKVASYLDVGCDSAEPAVRGVQNLLTRVPDIDAIFGECGTPALGAIQAIKQAGLPPSKIFVAGFDGLDAEIKAIQEGPLGATVGQRFFDTGRLAVEIAHKVLNGQSVPALTDPGSFLITKENAAQALQEMHKGE